MHNPLCMDYNIVHGIYFILYITECTMNDIQCMAYTAWNVFNESNKQNKTQRALMNTK